MNDFKSYASRVLNRLGHDGSDRNRWADHGSTRWLWKDQDVQEAIQYVVEEHNILATDERETPRGAQIRLAAGVVTPDGVQWDGLAVGSKIEEEVITAHPAESF